MFVRKKKNASGSVSVQVIDKANGYRVVKTIGCTKTPAEVNRLVAQGKAFIDSENPQFSLFSQDETRNAIVLDFLSHLSNSHIRTIGPELIFGNHACKKQRPPHRSDWTKNHHRRCCHRPALNLSKGVCDKFGEFVEFMCCAKMRASLKLLNE